MSNHVAILGAGNAGRAMAAYLTLRGEDVHLYNRWEEEIADIATGDVKVSGWSDEIAHVKMVTTKLEAAVKGASVIVIVVPAFAHRFMAEQLAPILTDDQIVLVHPGLVGGALAVKNVISRLNPACRAAVAETITSIFACRLRVGGVHIRQILEQVSVGVQPKERTSEVLGALNALFDDRLTGATSVLETSMNNRNPVYHCPTMLANIARSQAEEDWPFADVVTDGVINLILGIDKERLAIARALGVPSVPFYQSLVNRLGHDAGSLKEQIRAVFLPGGASPLPIGLTHRYVSEDVPFGLVPWIRLAEWLGLQSANLRAVATSLATAAGKDFIATGLQLSDLGVLPDDRPSDWVARQ